MIKVFTAFSGYDSQCLALDRIKANYPQFKALRQRCAGSMNRQRLRKHQKSAMCGNLHRAKVSD